MNDVLRALGISAGILLLVVVVIVVLTMVAVRRGEASHGETEHALPGPSAVAKETASATTKPTKATVAESDEISVIQILLLGTGLFVLTVLFLVALSLIQHST
jgi:hypothetical protein